VVTCHPNLGWSGEEKPVWSGPDPDEPRQPVPQGDRLHPDPRGAAVAVGVRVDPHPLILSERGQLRMTDTPAPAPVTRDLDELRAAAKTSRKGSGPNSFDGSGTVAPGPTAPRIPLAYCREIDVVACHQW
jgi:hypothetical protein